MCKSLITSITLIKKYLIIYSKNINYLKPNFFFFDYDGRYLTPIFFNSRNKGYLSKDTKNNSFFFAISVVNFFLFFLSFPMLFRKPLFDGDFLYVSNNSTLYDSKVFSFNQGFVLEFYSDNNYIKNYMLIYSKLKTKILLPIIQESKFKDSILTKFIKDDIEKKNAVISDVGHLIHLFKKHNSFLKIEGGIIDDFSHLNLLFQDDNNIKSLNKIISYISKYDKVMIPLSYTHGDLSMSNIIIESFERIYFIDWEHFGIREFYYDFFFLLFNESYSFSRDFFINSYFEGRFDEYLTDLFLTFNITFNSNYKLTYFIRSFLIFINERVKPNFSNNALDKYGNIFESINLHIRILNKT
jgi:hypothetical protein